MTNFFQIKNITIKWFGHASFKIKTPNIVIYIDPYAGSLETYSEKADLVLISHDHYDHCDSDRLQAIKKSDTQFIGSKLCAFKLTNFQFNLKTMIAGELFSTKGIEIKTIPAYNVSKNFHQKDTGGLGYIISISGVKIYFAGDTDLILEMEKLSTENIDVAILPIGGTYTMGCVDAADAANKINAKTVIPMHYGSLPGLEMNAEKFKQKVNNSITVIVLEHN